MTDVLVLGGTGWLGGRIAARWRDAGARVTVLSRGTRSRPPGIVAVVGDRDDAGAYDAVAAHDWDEVVDVSSTPAHVAAAIAAIGPRAAHWTYISSVSVYLRADEPGADESAALAPPLADGETGDYARAKSAAEQAVRTLAGRAALVRPGLIVGPGDPTDRFGYWPARFAAAGDGPVLVPAGDGRAQVIDIDDLAAFVQRIGAAGWTGPVNAMGPSHPLTDVLRTVRDVVGHRGPVVAMSPSELRGRDVEHWSGPRSLPLWLPADVPGFAQRDGSAYRAAGGGIRPLAETVARVLADERARGLDRDRRAGLTRADELAILAAR